MISVIIPTYNRAHSLLRALESVFITTRSDYELIIVDDGSTDNTYEVIKPYLSKNVKYFHQKNEGVSAARNFGVTKASKDYLLFLDSDDEIISKHFAEILDKGIKGGCSCYGAILKREGEKDMLLEPKNLGPLFNHAAGLFLAGAFIIKKSVFEKAGGYDKRIFFGENEELGIRICEISEVKPFNQPLLISYRENQTTKNRKFSRAKMAQSIETYLSKHAEKMKVKSPAHLMNFNNRLAICYFVQREKSKAISILMKGVVKNKSFKTLRMLMLMIFFGPIYRKYLNHKGLE